MEPARVPLLLRAFVVQRLRVCDTRHAHAAPARRASKPGREEIYSRLGYRPAGAELGLPVAGKSNSLNRALGVGVCRKLKETIQAMSLWSARHHPPAHHDVWR